MEHQGGQREYCGGRKKSDLEKGRGAAAANNHPNSGLLHKPDGTERAVLAAHRPKNKDRSRLIQAASHVSPANRPSIRSSREKRVFGQEHCVRPGNTGTENVCVLEGQKDHI